MTWRIRPSPEHRGQGHHQRPCRSGSDLVVSARRPVGLVLPNCCRPMNADSASTSVSLYCPIRHSITQIRQSATGLRDQLLTATRPCKSQWI
jgi:hypothetical protein